MPRPQPAKKKLPPWLKKTGADMDLEDEKLPPAKPAPKPTKKPKPPKKKGK